jgi:hypothetical protein
MGATPGLFDVPNASKRYCDPKQCKYINQNVDNVGDPTEPSFLSTIHECDH